MLTNKKAVIFDLDGTLVDSMWLWRQIDIEYLGRFGIELPDTLQMEIEGMSFNETAEYMKKRFNIPDSVEKMKQDWNEMAVDFYKTRVPLKKGALDFLKYLKENNIKTGIATSNSKVLLIAALEAHDLLKYFDSVHTANEVEKGKPSPDIYLYVAEKLGVDPKDCLVFEDIDKGVLAGKAAGMTVCGIWDEYADKRGCNTKECADYFVEDYYELLEGSN